MTQSNQPANDPMEQAEDLIHESFVQPDETPDWAQGFADEDYADAVTVYEGQQLIAKFLSSNVVEVESFTPGEMEPREVVQVEVQKGTTATDRVYKLDSKNKNTGKIESEKLVQPGEIRSFWVSGGVLQKQFREYDPQPAEFFAVANLGKRDNRRGTNEYWAWRMTMKRPKVNVRAVRS
jgi:hypothetical protein